MLDGLSLFLSLWYSLKIQDFSWVDETDTFKSLVLSLDFLPMRKAVEMVGSIPI